MAESGGGKVARVKWRVKKGKVCGVEFDWSRSKLRWRGAWRMAVALRCVALALLAEMKSSLRHPTILFNTVRNNHTHGKYLLVNI